MTHVSLFFFPPQREHLFAPGPSRLRAEYRQGHWGLWAIYGLESAARVVTAHLCQGAQGLEGPSRN